jgi:hypothetical protein
VGRVDDIATDLAAEVRERNAFDLELHRFANELLDAALDGRDLEAELRRLRRMSRVHEARTRVRTAIYPYRERVGVWRRSVRARARVGSR